MKEMRRRHYEKNRDRYLADGRARYYGDVEKGRKLAREYALSKRQWLAAIKLERGCVDCGFKSHAEALQFDHLPQHEKKFNIGHRWGKNKKELLAEIAKCEVRCANCHAIKTALRRKGVH